MMGTLTHLTNSIKTGQLGDIGSLPRIRSKSSSGVKEIIHTRPTTVGGLLTSIGQCPTPAVLLGVCADGLPFLMELVEPEIGAVLVSCDKGMGKTHQLQVMADSALGMNPPSQFQLGILTFKPAEWHAWEASNPRRKYLQGIYAWYDPWAEGFIQSLVELAEARQEGRRNGADVLVMLDDLNFIEELSFEAQVNLHWLLEYGSQSKIWLIGALNAHQAIKYHYWVEPFRTRIIGRVTQDQNAKILAMRDFQGGDRLQPGEFRIWTGNGWRTYRLPLLGD